jgi:hypothetical protein
MIRGQKKTTGVQYPYHVCSSLQHGVEGTSFRFYCLLLPIPNEDVEHFLFLTSSL